IWEGVSCSGTQSFTPPNDIGIRAYLRSRQQGDRIRVSVFLINVTRCQGDWPATEEHVFQPQIRIHCARDAQLVPLDETRSGADSDEGTLAFLYRNCQSFARGHLCAAVWRLNDPERPHSSIPSPPYPPFHWNDGEHLFNATIIDRFSPADARS